MIDKIKDFKAGRAIFFFEDVYRDTAKDVVEKLFLLDEESNDPIFIVINSWGGGVSALFAMLDAIKAVKSEIHTIVLGEADSSAAVLASSGVKRYIGENSRTMIHEVSTWVIGKISEMEEDLKDAKVIQDKLVDILATNTGHTASEIDDLIYKTDVWMDAKESVEFGLIDEVMTESEDDFLESAGKSKIAASNTNISNEDIEFYKNVNKVFKNSNKADNVNASTIDSIDSKLNKLLNKTNKGNEMANTNTSQEQLDKLLNSVSTLTDKVNTLEQDKSSLETKMKDATSGYEAQLADITSKFEQANNKLEIEAEKARTNAIGNLKTSISNIVDKESADKLVNTLTSAKLDMSVITEISDVFNAVKPDVTTLSLSDFGKGTNIAKVTELEVMRPQA